MGWHRGQKKDYTLIISWNTVCKIKRKGDLGIRKCNETNLAMLAKYGFKPIFGLMCLDVSMFKINHYPIGKPKCFLKAKTILTKGKK